MSIYKVGIMSDTRLIEAPSALAAAVFYGVGCTNGNMQFMAAVYEENGKEYKGDRLPAMKWQFGEEIPTEAELGSIKAELKECRICDDERGADTNG